MGRIERPIVVEIAPKTYFINEFGIGAQYVLVGEERAMVIDTGTGLYDMKTLVETLTDKPYDVIATHYHGDHDGGSDQFAEVYMHPLDQKDKWKWPESTPEAIRQKAARMEEMRTVGHYEPGTFGWGWPRYDHIWPYEEVKKFPTTGKCVYKDLYDGQVFDLGNREVVVYHTPGHTPGSCSLLDKKRRILFAGDAMNSNVGTRSVGGAYSGVAVSTMLRGLLRIRDLRPQFDQTFTGHVSYANTIDVFSQPNFVLDDVIECLRSILRGDANIVEQASHLKPELIMKTALYGTAATIWNEEMLWEEGEEHIIP